MTSNSSQSCLSILTQGGQSALMESARCGKTGVVVELVKAGANVNPQNKVGG